MTAPHDQEEPAMPDFDNPQAQRLWHRAQAQWALAAKTIGAAQATYQENAIEFERHAFEQEASALNRIDE